MSDRDLSKDRTQTDYVCEKCGILFFDRMTTSLIFPTGKAPNWCRFCPKCLGNRNKSIIRKIRNFF